ncbi:E3 ubiquitin-protein ligase arih2 [Phytophthora pseudosyringae]|uniref:E3 ubiquitin-protein ligase arih2 n=1 Tax=Phytophthora pseudosyringae TaxID=221518 RepID=A0A8T1VX67_9STRA|nr:E3 ubiquitin-protein ligase arih2 [Phytophthora pseudosyringae]
MSKKVVLEEEEYVEALGQIIERDFFPDLTKLKKQTELLRYEEEGLPWTGTTLRTDPTTRGNTSVRSIASGSGWDQPTPTVGQSANDMEQSEETEADGEAATTLNRFVATHTSEDNESFNELQEKAVKDHQRRYHWAFDDDKEKGDPKLHLLANGEWISKEQRQIADEACAPKGPKDDRPSAPETWKYRARNPLLFPPALEATRDICQQPVGPEIGGGPTSSRKDYSLVPMTPVIAPGVDASPLMTWGDIEGTPTILGSRATPASSLSQLADVRDQDAVKKTTKDRANARITQCSRPHIQCSVSSTHPARLRPAVTSKLFYTSAATTPFIHDTEDEVIYIRAQQSKVVQQLSVFQHKKATKLTAHRKKFYNTNSMTINEEVYKAVIVGGGPAGIGVFVRAARAGLLPRLLNPEKLGTAKDNDLRTQLGFKQLGVTVLHAGDANTFGGGNLGEYIINSNTFACSLLASVLDEKPDLDPPERIKNTFLEKARGHESAKLLEEIGTAPGNLTEIGRFLRYVGTCLIDEIADKAPDTSRVLLNTTASKYEALENGLIRVEARSTDGTGGTVILYAEHLILATGGTQELPSLDNPAYHSKLFASDSCLREDGFAKLKEHLLAQPAGERKVCIVGGSHSSFSVAWLLLNKFVDSKAVTCRKVSLSSGSLRKQSSSDPKKTKEECETALVLPHLASIGAPVTAIAPVSPLTVTKCDTSVKVKRTSLTCTSGDTSSPKSTIFNPKSIMILHRSPIRCYYGSKKEAEADGADASRVDRSGCVNTFTGLREDAKRLFKSVTSGREVRVRLFQVNQQGSQAITDKAYATAGAIVWGAGYKTNLPPGFDEAGNPLVFRQDNGVVKLDNKARLQLLGPVKGKRPSVLGLGLGFSLRSAVDEMGFETRVDGVTVYHRRGAALVLEALFGPEVYGTSSSFEEMVEKQEKKKREAQALKAEKAADKVRSATGSAGGEGEHQALASPHNKHIARSGSVTTAHSPAKLGSLTSPTARKAIVRRPSKPAASDKKASPKKTDSAATNPPVKLLLLRRRISADEAAAAAAEPPELSSAAAGAAPEPAAAEPEGPTAIATAADR